MADLVNLEPMQRNLLHVHRLSRCNSLWRRNFSNASTIETLPDQHVTASGLHQVCFKSKKKIFLNKNFVLCCFGDN